MKKRIVACLLSLACLSVFAGEISFSSGGSFNLTSRTSFGVNLDHPYRYGIKQELTDFKLRIDLVPYQKLSNAVNSASAVGFVNMTFFDLGLEISPLNQPNDGNGGYNAASSAMTNRFQTGEFIAGIAKGNWIYQFNAGGAEPFGSPWNNGIQYVSDRVAFTWAFLQSMVDVKRTSLVAELRPEDEVVKQFQQDNLDFKNYPSTNKTDTLGWNLGWTSDDKQGSNNTSVAVLYNKEESFGFNLKFGTEYDYSETSSTPDNRNGLAAGFDLALDPAFTHGVRVYSSIAGAYDYDEDSNPDPIMGGIQIAPVIALNEDISLEPFVATDLGTKITESGDVDPLEYEAAVGLTMRWPGEAGWYTDYILEKDGRVFPGMSASYKVYGTIEDSVNELQHNAKFTLFEPRGDEGIFYGLGSEIIVDINDITKKEREILATIYLDYTKVGVLKGPGSFIPWTTICFDDVPGTISGRINGLKVDLGAKLDGAISNTVLGLSWHSGDLIQTNSVAHFGIVKTTVEIKY